MYKNDKLKQFPLKRFPRLTTIKEIVMQSFDKTNNVFQDTIFKITYFYFLRLLNKKQDK